MNFKSIILNTINPFALLKNKIKSKKSQFFFNKIRFKGHGNIIVCDEISKVKLCKIIIKGNNNTINIGKKSNLTNCFLEIHGNECAITIGENTIIGETYLSSKGHSKKITIGDNCMFSRKIQLLTSDGHPIYSKIDDLRINPEKNINIGNRVWIAADVTILKDVTLGNDVVIGCNSVVTNNVADNSIAVGIPARIIKKDIYWSK